MTLTKTQLGIGIIALALILFLTGRVFYRRGREVELENKLRQTNRELLNTNARTNPAEHEKLLLRRTEILKRLGNF